MQKKKKKTGLNEIQNSQLQSNVFCGKSGDSVKHAIYERIPKVYSLNVGHLHVY